MGKISKAMRKVPEAMEELEKVTDEVTDASQNARKALKRSDSGSPTPHKPAATTPQSGPVTVKVPQWASQTEVKQFEEYAAGSNRAVAADALSKDGRVPTTKNGVRRDAEKAAYRERKRAEQAGTPYEGVAGHVPDATWMGQGEPHEWQDMSKRVNSSLAGQANAYPLGYKPTHFDVEYPDTT